MEDSSFTRIIGRHGNKEIAVKYCQEAYIRFTDKEITKTPSLYEYQLSKRLLK